MGAEQENTLPPGGESWEVPENQRGLTPEIVRRVTVSPYVKILLLRSMGEAPTEQELQEARMSPDTPSFLGVKPPAVHISSKEAVWATASGALLGAGIFVPGIGPFITLAGMISGAVGSNRVQERINQERARTDNRS